MSELKDVVRALKDIATELKKIRQLKEKANVPEVIINNASFTKEREMREESEEQ